LAKIEFAVVHILEKEKELGFEQERVVKLFTENVDKEDRDSFQL
jgi:hypothetical protein